MRSRTSPATCAYQPEQRNGRTFSWRKLLVSDKLLRRISAGFFLYAIIGLAESGIDLIWKKSGLSFYPRHHGIVSSHWEIYEIIRKVTWMRVRSALPSTCSSLFISPN